MPQSAPEATVSRPVETTTRAGVGWKRALGMFVVCMVAVGVLAFALIMGVIPVSFGISQNPVKLTMERLEGTRMTTYVGTDAVVEDGQKAGKIAALEGGEIHSLCLSTALDLPVIGALSIQIRSGESEPIPFSKMTAHLDGLIIGDVAVRNVQLGLDGADLSRNDLIQGPDGSWGLQFDNATVHNLKASADRAQVGQLRLRGLGLNVELGEHHCY